ncbi:MAG: acetyl-CoA carboxylase biotin carboxylase subunit [Rhodobacteraceae bacterium]|nr:acetyl-CoA carboxylase biotin carboxylase subunit [Paracoccaceae bacterium]
MFSKILIANRGEIALRIIRTCRELGIATVAVHTTVDQDAMHARLADETVCIGPPRGPGNRESYLNDAAIISAALVTGAEAIHPGYGFLSENAEFAEHVAEQGITFIGPSAEHIRIMGDKRRAKETMLALGVPCVPGSGESLDSLDNAMALAGELGYPVFIKASAGGGGRGMKLANSEAEFESAFLSGQQEALAAFGNPEVYLEKYLDNGRHIEIQVFGDGKGNAVHFGERDCSLQRRQQKLLEEAPSPVLSDTVRETICTLSARTAAQLGYAGAGTIEFLYQDNSMYFIEMNTRLQVEHPVTELVYGIDLVEEQLRIAAGLPLSRKQADIKAGGHAIEVRINAESVPQFLPQPGRVALYHAPGGPGVRVDSALYSGYTIPSNYDSMIGKILVSGKDRATCTARMRRALSELIIHPNRTNVPLFMRLLETDEFTSSTYNTRWLEQWVETWQD